MTFTGWQAEAAEFFEGLAADNSKAYWQAHKSDYVTFVEAPMAALLAELATEFGSGRIFRPYRDVRFSRDKTPYKLNCAAHLGGGYISFSAEELFVGSGLYMPDAIQLARYRSAVDDEKSGTALESILEMLRSDGFEVGALESLKTAPKGYPKDHPRIDLLNQKGVIMSKSWPVGSWTKTAKTKQRAIATLTAARPLNAWIRQHAE